MMDKRSVESALDLQIGQTSLWISRWNMIKDEVAFSALAANDATSPQAALHATVYERMCDLDSNHNPLRGRHGYEER